MEINDVNIILSEYFDNNFNINISLSHFPDLDIENKQEITYRDFMRFLDQELVLLENKLGIEFDRNTYNIIRGELYLDVDLTKMVDKKIRRDEVQRVIDGNPDLERLYLILYLLEKFRDEQIKPDDKFFYFDFFDMDDPMFIIKHDKNAPKPTPETFEELMIKADDHIPQVHGWPMVEIHNAIMDTVDKIDDVSTREKSLILNNKIKSLNISQRHQYNSYWKKNNVLGHMGYDNYQKVYLALSKEPGWFEKIYTSSSFKNDKLNTFFLSYVTNNVYGYIYQYPDLNVYIVQDIERGYFLILLETKLIALEDEFNIEFDRETFDIIRGEFNYDVKSSNNRLIRILNRTPHLEKLYLIIYLIKKYRSNDDKMGDKFFYFDFFDQDDPMFIIKHKIDAVLIEPETFEGLIIKAGDGYISEIHGWFKLAIHNAIMATVNDDNFTREDRNMLNDKIKNLDIVVNYNNPYSSYRIRRHWWTKNRVITTKVHAEYQEIYRQLAKTKKNSNWPKMIIYNLINKEQLELHKSDKDYLERLEFNEGMEYIKDVVNYFKYGRSDTQFVDRERMTSGVFGDEPVMFRIEEKADVCTDITDIKDIIIQAFEADIIFLIYNWKNMTMTEICSIINKYEKILMRYDGNIFK